MGVPWISSFLADTTIMRMCMHHRECLALDIVPDHFDRTSTQ